MFCVHHSDATNHAGRIALREGTNSWYFSRTSAVTMRLWPTKDSPSGDLTLTIAYPAVVMEEKDNRSQDEAKNTSSRFRDNMSLGM